MSGDDTSTTTGPAAQWAEALRSGRLLIQHCADCGHHVFYPRRLCPDCHSGRLGWVPADGRGTVHAVTVVARPASRGADYNVVLVDLVEGVRMMGRVDGIAADAVRIGMAVRASIIDGAQGPMVVFTPDPA
jgi:hypothetical protein